MPVSIIIPTLNEEDAIVSLLRRLPPGAEVIVADGGSRDATVPRAQAAGARIVPARRGRGTQLHAGAQAATGDILWFLHADASPAPGSVELLTRALAQADAGVFRPRFAASPFLTWLYPKLRWCGLTYGDAGLFVRRAVYEASGGFPPIPLFEDVEFIRRLRRRGRFVDLPHELPASSRRFQGRMLRTWMLWLSLQALYTLGVPPERLALWYRR